MRHDFTDYLKSLSKSARHNYKVTMRENEGRVHCRIGFEKNLVAHFMNLWELQVVNGAHPKWVFGPEYFEAQEKAGRLRLFAAYEKCKIVAIHPAEQHGSYMYCHPPCYDKRSPELAKFMWFGLMKWACKNAVEFVDLGGGSNGTWRDCAMSHVNGSFKYKWLYVPKETKDYPDEEIPYIQMRCDCGHKQLILGPESCESCGRKE